MVSSSAKDFQGINNNIHILAVAGREWLWRISSRATAHHQIPIFLLCYWGAFVITFTIPNWKLREKHTEKNQNKKTKVPRDEWQDRSCYYFFFPPRMWTKFHGYRRSTGEYDCVCVCQSSPLIKERRARREGFFIFLVYLQREWWRWEWRIKGKKGSINWCVCVCGRERRIVRKKTNKIKKRSAFRQPGTGKLLDCPKRDSAICSFSFLLIVYPRKKKKSFGISLSASREIYAMAINFSSAAEIERRRRSIPPPVS